MKNPPYYHENRHLRAYVKEQPHGFQRRLASQIGVSESYLSQLILGRFPIQPELAVRLETLTQNTLSRKQLRPTDWPAIWPELKHSE